MSWISLALLSAVFAGLTALLAKVGVENVPANLATLVRTAVIVTFTAGIVAIRGEWRGAEVSTRSWVFLVLSGLATGLSWLCYFAALKRGPISGVAMGLGFVVLREPVRPLTLVGAVLIVVGVLLTLPGVQRALGW